MTKRWSENETTYLKRYAAKKRVVDLADRFGIDADSVRAKLNDMDLAAADHKRLTSEPDPGIESLDKGVKALHAKKYAQAEKHLVQAEAAARRGDVANHARRYLAMARSRLVAETEATNPYLEAVYERNQGNLRAALEICSRGGRQSKDDRFAHLAASIWALKGEVDKAAKLLETAIRINPRNRVLAHHDADFAVLREDPRFADLFAAAD